MTDWPLLLLVAIDVLAVHRLTRLVTSDIITVKPRWAVIRWAYLRAGHTADVVDGDGSSDNALDQLVEADMVDDPCGVPRPAVLVVCRWCASVWVAAGAVASHALVPSLWLPLAGVLALSTASTLLAGLEE